jgi:hypothetical protein
MIDWDEARAGFARDGVVFLPAVLGATELEAAREAWRWSLSHPALGGKDASYLPIGERMQRGYPFRDERFVKLWPKT